MELVNRICETLSLNSSLQLVRYHCKVSGFRLRGERRGSFPPKMLNFPPKQLSFSPPPPPIMHATNVCEGRVDYVGRFQALE